MHDDFTPGQPIALTITRVPAREDARQTIARLMRQDATTSRALKSANQRRRRDMRYKQRGGRRWAIRPKATKALRVAEGASWTMRYTPLLRNDLRSVGDCLKAEPVS